MRFRRCFPVIIAGAFGDEFIAINCACMSVGKCWVGGADVHAHGLERPLERDTVIAAIDGDVATGVAQLVEDRVHRVHGCVEQRDFAADRSHRGRQRCRLDAVGITR